MSLQTILIALGLLALANCVVAFVLGRSAERFGAAIILGNQLLGFAVEAMTAGPTTHVLELVVNALTALILLALTLRFASFWLGAVMLLYALQFALDAYYFVLEQPRDMVHVVLNDADFFGVNAALLVGTLMAWLHRRQIATSPGAWAEPAP